MVSRKIRTCYKPEVDVEDLGNSWSLKAGIEKEVNEDAVTLKYRWNLDCSGQHAPHADIV